MPGINTLIARPHYFIVGRVIRRRSAAHREAMSNEPPVWRASASLVETKGWPIAEAVGGGTLGRGRPKVVPKELMCGGDKDAPAVSDAPTDSHRATALRATLART